MSISNRNRRNDYDLAHIDMLYGMLSTFVVLWIIAFALMGEKDPKDTNAKVDAQALITIEWPGEVECDVDLWVKDPNGDISFYLYKDKGGGHLERDDLGNNTDTIYINGQPTQVKDNQETWVMRNYIPGTYRTNVHLFSCADGSNGKLAAGTSTEVPVKLSLTQINPRYQAVGEKLIVLPAVWAEEMGLMFDMSSKGTMSNVHDSDQLFMEEVQVLKQPSEEGQ